MKLAIEINKDSTGYDVELKSEVGYPLLGFNHRDKKIVERFAVSAVIEAFNLLGGD